MDRQTVALFIPILALTIGLAATVFSGLVRLQKARQREGAVAGGDVAARIEALEEHVGSLQRQLGETQERLDFAERLLARPQAPHRE